MCCLESCLPASCFLLPLQGADYVYEKFFVPVLMRHEAVIDSHLKDVQEQGQAAVVYLWQQGCMHAQVGFMDFLGYLSTLSVEAARQAVSQHPIATVLAHSHVLCLKQLNWRGRSGLDGMCDAVDRCWQHGPVADFASLCLCCP